MRPDFKLPLTRAILDGRQEAVPQRPFDGSAQLLLRREFRPEFGQIGRDRASSERAAPGGATARIKTPNGRDLLANIRDAQQRLHAERESWSKTGQFGRDGLHNKHAPRSARAQIKNPDELDFLIRTIRDSLQRIDLLRKRLSVPEQVGRDNRGARAEVASVPPPQVRRMPLQDRLEQGLPVQRAAIVVDPPERQPEIRSANHNRARIWASILIVAGAFTTGIYARDSLVPAIVSIWHRVQLFKALPAPLVATPLVAVPDARLRAEPLSSPAQTAVRQPAPAGRSVSALPLPDSYGLYVVSNGKLTRLESLRMRVPDARIALGGLITKPSSVVVPNGRLSFIAYQRDLIANAPDSVSVRIVAKVMRALTFAATGKPATATVADTWAVRAVSDELTVAPVPDNQEMVLIRPADPARALSPGRYMLVFKNQAYDFTVEGAIADTAHCLERADTQDGVVYTECRSLP